MENLVLYGGGFDPIHNGHIRIAIAASKAFNAEVLLIPNRVPPWKTPNTDVASRLAMIRLAIKEAGTPSLKLSTYEIDNNAEVNYSIDTVKHYKALYPNKKIYLLIGADSANSFSLWRCPDEIADLVQIVVTPRPGAIINADMVERFHMIRLDYGESGDVSSSAVRALQHNDVPSSVRNYIEKHGLYYMQGLKKRLTEHRFAHSLEVARLAYRIALENHLERPWRLYIAGLLHDIAKEQGEKVAKMIMKKEYPCYLALPPWTYHQFVGSLLAEREFRIQDQEILDAIACHATGKPNMGPLDKILYSSDKIEPTRGYDSRGYIKACLKDYEKGFLIVLKANMEFYQEKGWDFTDNPLTKECVKQYLGDSND